MKVKTPKSILRRGRVSGGAGVRKILKVDGRVKGNKGLKRVPDDLEPRRKLFK